LAYAAADVNDSLVPDLICHRRRRSLPLSIQLWLQSPADVVPESAVLGGRQLLGNPYMLLMPLISFDFGLR
jgi:hypothetical protein